jgi:CrcB protein
VIIAAMVRFLLVCLGGALGTGARYLIATVAVRATSKFPVGTLTVNVVGSFLMTLIMTIALTKGATMSEDTRLFLTTGFLGGFTTYSSFNFETLRLAQGGALPTAITYAAVTFLACLLSGLLGTQAARLL